MKTYLLFLSTTFLLVIGSTLFYSCKDLEPNPCIGLEPFTASFKMGIHFSGGAGEWEIDTLIASDTVINKKFITFKADEAYDSYAWTIGNDPRAFTEQTVSLLFEYPEDSLKIQLIAKTQPNTVCFPQDNGIDTVVHYLTIIKREDNPIIGKYRGYLESDLNTEMEVEVISEPEIFGVQIFNVNNGCNPTISDSGTFWSGIDLRITYKTIYFADNLQSPTNFAFQNNCLDPRGWASLDSLGKNLTINFSTGAREGSEPPYIYLPNNRAYDVYHGIKIN